MTAVESDLIVNVKRKRDMVSFQQLVLSHQERVYYLIRKMTGSHEDAQDLVQDTFIKCLRNIDQLKDNKKFAAWINKLAVNMVIDFKRRKINNGKVSLSGEIPVELISDKLIVKDEQKTNGIYKKEFHSQLDNALFKLPVNHREAFIMFHHQKMPVKMIAEYMESNEATVRSYIFRAIQKLKVYLKDYSETFKD